jgi:hypothetical protein
MRHPGKRSDALVASARETLATADPVGYWSEVPAVRVARGLYQRMSAPDGWLLMVAGPIVGLIIALWMTAPDWGSRPPGGNDTLAHVVRAQFASGHIINHGLVDAWDPSFVVGYEEFLFDGPGLSWAVFLTRLLTFNTLSFTGAIKVIAVGSFAVLPLIVAFTARSFGLNRRAAGLSAIASLLIDSPYGGAGLSGMFGNGLITNGFGALFFFLTIGGFVRVIREKQIRWVVFTGISLAVLSLTHGISVMELGVMLLIIILLWFIGLHVPNATIFYARAVKIAKAQLAAEAAPGGPTISTPTISAPTMSATTMSTPAEFLADNAYQRSWSSYRSSWRTYWPVISRVFVATALGFALSAVVLVPLAVHDNIRGPASAWTTVPFGQLLLVIWQGSLLLRPGIAPFLIAGEAYGIFRMWKGRPFALPVAAAPIALLIVGNVSLHYWSINILTYQLTNRGLGYAGVLATFPLAALIARATKNFPLRDLLAIAVAAALVVLPIGDERQQARQTPQAIPQMFKAAQLLKSLVPPTARFASEQSGNNATGVPVPDDWFAWASERNTLDTFNIESAQAVGMSNVVYDLGSQSPTVSADDLAQVGVTDVVTITVQTANLLASSTRFHEVWGSPPIAIFAVLPSIGQPPPAELITAQSPLSAKLVAGGPEHDVIDVDARVATQASLAIAWSPKWHASLDGKAVQLSESPEGLLEVAIPAGRHRLEVRFQRDLADYVGLAISLATLLGLVAYVVGRWGGRRAGPQRTAQGAAQGAARGAAQGPRPRRRGEVARPFGLPRR